jgi:hypothetical protein
VASSYFLFTFLATKIEVVHDVTEYPICCIAWLYLLGIHSHIVLPHQVHRSQ